MNTFAISMIVGGIAQVVVTFLIFLGIRYVFIRISKVEDQSFATLLSLVMAILTGAICIPFAVVLIN